MFGDGKGTLQPGKPPLSSGTARRSPLGTQSLGGLCLLITGLMPRYDQEKFLSLTMSGKQL